MPEPTNQTDQCDAWNPGINSTIPKSLKPQVTLFRPENAYIDYAQAQELADFCGLRPAELISLRPERLLIHELLIRVSGDLSVPDGPAYEALGINLRSMVATIYDHYVLAEMPLLVAAFDECKSEAQCFIEDQLSTHIFATPASTTQTHQSLWQRAFGDNPKKKETRISALPEIKAIKLWTQQQTEVQNKLHQSCLKALVAVTGAIVGNRGRLLPDPELICRLATNQVCNQHGSIVLGKQIEPIIEKAASQENYRYLPMQETPVIMNVKGASASGKSTIRPQQTELAKKLDIPWEDFALISPDYWRKYLLDYDSLGENHKYAAMLTGQELEIIDKKLDSYMAEKAAAGNISHMLIDRFRFDSFTVDTGGSTESRLLSRFGERVFMFFLVTPPAETVIRAWKRGKSTGRYKAVDDLLYHNVEAFTGMPALFFSWILANEKQIHFEFLDNDVPEGNLPKTAAFGWNNSLTILDIDLMLNIDRYRQVNIEASRPEEIFDSTEKSAITTTEFLNRCINEISEVVLADQNTSQIYARFNNGKLLEFDRDYISQLPDESNAKRTLTDLGLTDSNDKTPPIGKRTMEAGKERHYTLGRWGDA